MPGLVKYLPSEQNHTSRCLWPGIPETNLHPSRRVTCSGGTPARNPGRARSNLASPVYSALGRAAARPGAGGQGRPGRGAPGAPVPLALARRSGSRGGRRGDHPGEALRAPALPPPGCHSPLIGRRGLRGTSLRGFTRVHTSRVKRLEGAPVSPGCRPAGEEARTELRSPLARDSPASRPGPRPPGAGCDLTRFPPGAGSRAARGPETEAAPRTPALPSGNPAPAPAPPAPRDVNAPARPSGGSRAGCARGALVSDPGKAIGGILST